MTDAMQAVPQRRPWLAAVLSALIPGAGQAYAGRWGRAAVWFAPAMLALIGLIPVSSMRTTDLVGSALSPTVLWSIFTVNALAAIWRVGAAADAFVVADQNDPADHHAIGLAVGWAVIGLAVLAPHLAVGRYTYDTVTLVEAVFVTDGEQVPDTPIIPIGTDADIVPDPAVTTTYDRQPSDPKSTRNLIFRDGVGDPEAIAAWDGIVATRRGSPGGAAPFLAFEERVGGDRITILFAGGDGGPGRGGLRTDSMMVASIDPANGKAALFSFPRNMAQVPVPSKFKSAFSDLQRRMEAAAAAKSAGSTTTTTTAGDGSEEGSEPQEPEFENCECFPEQLNALYPFTRRWTRTYPGEVDPGMAALRDTLAHLMGVRIDYYALIDMAAFVDLVDAIGGIDVYALQPLESEVSPPREGDPWAYVNIEPGWNHLDGPEALAYARARKGSSDYARMERQRCMVKAVAAKADPITLLTSFPAIVDAIQGSVVTDIPLTFLPDLLEATAGLDFDDIETVGITHSYWEPKRDYNGKPIPRIGAIRSKVSRVFAGQSDPVAEATVSAECEV